MRDALVQVTTALTGSLGTTINSDAIGLGHDAATGISVGSPLTRGYELEVYLPSDPTGSSPSIQIWLQFKVGGSWSGNAEGILVLDTDTSTTRYPANVPLSFYTPTDCTDIRTQFVLANTNNVYGSVVTSLVMGNRRQG
jgi:hypothetical protein